MYDCKDLTPIPIVVFSNPILLKPTGQLFTVVSRERLGEPFSRRPDIHSRTCGEAIVENFAE